MPVDTAILERAGITVGADEIERLLNEAIARWVPPYVPPDARTGLPPATLAALRAVGVPPNDLAPLRPDEPRADLRAAAAYAGLVASALTVAQTAARLGVDPSRIRQRLAARTLFGIRVDGGWRLPLCQLTDDGGQIVPGFGTIAPRLTDVHPLDAATWFTTPNCDLVVNAGEDETVAISPRDWLLRGGDPADLLPLVDELDDLA